MQRNSGFTLPEVLVACLLLAVLAIMALRAFNAIAETRAHIADEATYWREVDAVFARLESDVAHLDPTTAAVTHPTLHPVLRLAHGSASSNREYVAYRLTGETLEWLTWQAPATPETATASQLLTGVQSFRIESIGEDLVWHEHWPPTGQRLLGLRVELRTLRNETYRRILALP